MGGGTALQLAFRHPHLVSRLVVLSAPFSHTSWHAGVMKNFRTTGSHQAPQVMDLLIFHDHAALAPRPEEFPALLDKLGVLLGHHAYDWSAHVTGVIVKADLFVAALPFSGLIFLRAYVSMRTDAWLDGHVKAFDYLGGVPQLIVPDNALTTRRSRLFDFGTHVQSDPAAHVLSAISQ